MKNDDDFRLKNPQPQPDLYDSEFDFLRIIGKIGICVAGVVWVLLALCLLIDFLV